MVRNQTGELFEIGRFLQLKQEKHVYIGFKPLKLGT